jgi:hypothetical protein
VPSGVKRKDSREKGLDIKDILEVGGNPNNSNTKHETRKMIEYSGLLRKTKTVGQGTRQAIMGTQGFHRLNEGKVLTRESYQFRLLFERLLMDI